MSSTNRGYERHIQDHYITPERHIKRFLEAFQEKIGFSDILEILDPCAGGNEKYDMPYPKILMDFFPLSKISTNDIRFNSKAVSKVDYLKYFIVIDKVDLIISNPPFDLAKEFILKACKDVKETGYVIFFLRFSFLASKERKAFFDEYMPTYIFLHHDRPSFIPEDIAYTDKLGRARILKAGSTDSCEYAHFVWDMKNFNSKSAELFII